MTNICSNAFFDHFQLSLKRVFYIHLFITSVDDVAVVQPLKSMMCVLETVSENKLYVKPFFFSFTGTPDCKRSIKTAVRAVCGSHETGGVVAVTAEGQT